MVNSTGIHEITATVGVEADTSTVLHDANGKFTFFKNSTTATLTVAASSLSSALAVLQEPHSTATSITETSTVDTPSMILSSSVAAVASLETGVDVVVTQTRTDTNTVTRTVVVSKVSHVYLTTYSSSTTFSVHRVPAASSTSSPDVCYIPPPSIVTVKTTVTKTVIPVSEVHFSSTIDSSAPVVTNHSPAGTSLLTLSYPSTNAITLTLTSTVAVTVTPTITVTHLVDTTPSISHSLTRTVIITVRPTVTVTQTVTVTHLVATTTRRSHSLTRTVTITVTPTVTATQQVFTTIIEPGSSGLDPRVDEHDKNGYVGHFNHSPAVSVISNLSITPMQTITVTISLARTPTTNSVVATLHDGFHNTSSSTSTTETAAYWSNGSTIVIPTTSSVAPCVTYNRPTNFSMSISPTVHLLSTSANATAQATHAMTTTSSAVPAFTGDAEGDTGSAIVAAVVAALVAWLVQLGLF